MQEKHLGTCLIPLACATIAACSAMGEASDLPFLDSSKFDFKYEMDVLPTFADLDDNGIVDFTGGGN